jgi:PAS domain-containing protein
MLAESISDVIFSTDSLLRSTTSARRCRRCWATTEWIFQNGWQSIIANPQQLTGIYSLMERVSKASATPSNWPLRTTQTQLFLFDCLRADGRKIPIELRLVLVWDEHGASRRARRRPRHQPAAPRRKDLRMAATVFEHSTSAILITDPAGYIVQANEAFSRVSGYAVAEVLDQLPGMLTVDEPAGSPPARAQATAPAQAAGKAKWLKRRTASITRPGSASPRYSTTKATWPATCASSATSASARPANSASTAWPTTTP